MKGVQSSIAKEFGAVTAAADAASKHVGTKLSDALQGAAKTAGSVARGVKAITAETVKMADNMARGFKTGAVDGFAASLGALGKTGVAAMGSLVKSIPGVTTGFEKVRDLALAGPRAFSQFAAGFKSPTAAASMFTGVMGDMGGKTRAALDGVIGKTSVMGRSIIAPAQNFVAGFKAMNGGAGEFTGVMGNLGAHVGKALSPMVNVAKNVGGAFQHVASTIGPAMGNALSAVGNFAKDAVSHIAQIPGKIADTFRGPATAAVVAGMAAIGVAVNKGMNRLTSLDTATAKMRGLGYQGKEVGQIMANATEAVTGTAYGLDEASTVAAGALAAQIKPGKELTAHLKNVANNAAAAGVSMDEMGSLFNKAATQANGVQNDIIGQLADKGIPIYEELGKQMGVTSGEVFKLASQGKVSFEMFSAAAEAAAGTVAEEMGTTLPGALSNMWASVARIGQNVLGGINKDTGEMYGLYAKLAPMVDAVTGALKRLEPIAAAFGSVLSEKVGPVLDRVIGWFNRLGDSADGVAGKFGGVLSAVAPAGAMFAALGAGGLVPLIGKLGPLAGLLGPLPKMLGAIGGPAGIAAAGLLALAQVDPSSMAAGFQAIAAKLPSMIDGIVGMVANLAGEIIPSLLQGLTANVPVLLDGITGMISTVLSALVGALPMLMDAAVTLFMGLVQALVEIVPPLLESVLALIPMIINALVEMLPTLIAGAIQLFMGLVQALIEIVPPLLESIYALLPEILSSLISLLPALIEGSVQLFMGIVTALPEIIPPLIDAVIGLIPVVVETLVSMIDTLMTGAIQLFTAIVTALPEIIPALIQAFIDLGPVLVQAVADLIPLLFQAGKDLLGGLVGGIKDMAGNAVDALKEVGSKMLNGIKGFFGIHSPSTVMAGIGGFLDAGLAGGLGKGTASVGAMKATANQITAVTNQLQASMGNTVKVIGSQVNAIISSLQQLVAMMSSAFRNGVTQQLNAVAKIFQTVVPNAARLMATQTQASLTGLQSWMGTFKNSLVSVLNAIKAAFMAVPSAVVSSWARIKSGTASPTNYVISTVYMNGLRSAVNAIASSTGIGVNMPAVRSVGYASGGVLPGYTPGRDIYDFYSPRFGTLRLGGGEAILRPEVVKALGGAPTINAWNRSRGVGISNKGDRGYASGGILDFLNKGSNGWSVNAKHPDFSFSLFDNPKNAISQLVTQPTREYANRAGGGQVGRAFANSMPALADALGPSLVRKINALGGGGAGLVAAARKALGVPYVWGGASIPPGLDCSGLVYWAYQQMGKKNVPRLTAAGYQSVATPVSSPRAGDVIFWGNPAHHIAIATGAGQMVHAPKPGDVVRNAAIYGNPTYGRLKYDQGGYLPPGLTLVENRTGKPEPVFTHDQFEDMRMGVRDVYFNVDVSTVQELAEATDAMKTLSLKLKMGG